MFQERRFMGYRQQNHKKVGLYKPFVAQIPAPCALDAIPRSAEFDVCPAGFHSHFGTIPPF
jgi:hypothetical protein